MCLIYRVLNLLIKSISKQQQQRKIISDSEMKLIIFAITIIHFLHLILCFDFKQVQVTPDSYVINTLTTYQIQYNRKQDNSFTTTSYATQPITSSDTITVTFPSQYTLTTVTCLVQIDGGASNSQSCSVSGNVVTVTGAFTANTFVETVVLWVSNINNPTPAITTSEFSGTIGSDVAIPNGFSSIVELQPGAFQSCSVTFNPSYVNSTGNMIITLINENQIGTTGSIVITFPDNRWTNDISTTNYLPITTIMTCTNQSSNIRSSLQCSGSNVENSVTASSMFLSAISSATELSFSVDSFLSPPSTQPVDAITITSYISGSRIDTCTTFVTSLIPNEITDISVLSTAGTGLTVNDDYTIRFNLTLVDVLSQSDHFRITFPSGTVMSFLSTTISSNVGIIQSSATFVSNVLSLSMNDIGRTFGAGSSIIFTVGTYTAPSSIKTTDPITIQILNNGYSKMQGTVTITAQQSTLSGLVSLLSSTVNTRTSYTFTITTLDPMTSTGKIKISIPSTITIDISSSTCANISGSGMRQFPVCSVNLTQNSITLTDINSTSSLIAIQTFSVTVQGLINPPSTSPTQSFSVSTYYQSTDDTLVATGSLDPINATVATIASGNIAVTASSYIVNEQSVTYSLQMTVSNAIPAGGSFSITIPFDITLDVLSAPSHCSININSTSYISTDCTVELGNNSYIITFTNPFSSDASSGTVFIARVSSVSTNPISTQPTESFGIQTFHSDGYSIAQISSSLTIQMNTAASFNSIAVSRLGNTNYQLTTYTFVISQDSPLEPSSIIIITFPSDIIPSVTSVCSITLPSSQTLSCSLSSSTLSITLPNSDIGADTSISISVTEVRNPPSFDPAGDFTIQSKTANNLYTYSYGISAVILSNSIASSFQSITYEFLPTTLDTSVSLKVTFDPSNSSLTPSSLWLTLANSIVINSLSCNSFIDFTGTCSFTDHTVQVSGTFTSAPMSFSVTGFTTPIFEPTDYSTIVTFDSNNFKIDESDTDIIFAISCLLPCRTCTINGTDTCTDCYENTAVTQKIYFDEDLFTCKQICVDGKFEDISLFKCSLCDSNCETCQNSAIFCETCDQTTIYKVLYVADNTTQTCVSTCPQGLYTDATIDPVSCSNCISPCITCSDIDVCESCVSGTFLYNSSCLNDCPNDITIENPSNNECDFCDTACATCTGTTTNCTSCAQDKLFYLNQCLSSCPSPLVPQNGTCGPCDENCQTCSGDKFTCTSCDTSSSIPYLLNQMCLTNCPQLYYEDIASGICSLCSSIPDIHCVNCSSESTCLSCDSGYILLNSTCLDYVPSGYVNISNVAEACTGDCATCDIIVSNCTSCSFNNLLNHQCLQNCPSGYIALSKQCEACLSPCFTCESTTDTCTSCITSLTPDVFLTGNQCLQTCPDSTFANTATNTCDDCQSPCEYCTSITTCTTCLNGFFLEDGACPTACKTGFAGVNRVCQACQGNCLTCENQTTLCTTCVTGTYLYNLNNECVTDCAEGLFIDILIAECVSCLDPCKTCINSSSTCLSCFTGVLYNNICQDNCPDKFFNLSGACEACPDNCSSCTSLTTCTGCINNLVLYNSFCIQICPSTHSVIINNQCTACSDTFCHQCTSADVCTTCESDKSLLNGACLTDCPAGFETNGTHCLDTNEEVLSTSTSFPVPFSIAAVIFIIACLMSKLQFNHTYIAGAIYSLLSILEWGALGYFLYLYFTQFFQTQPLPLFIGLAALGYLYILNIFATIIQNAIVCSDKQFKGWYYGCNKCFYIFANFFAFFTNHKFRNIVFCKLFTFSTFSGQLEATQKFKVFNVFSFLSLLHSGAAIFSAAVAIGNVTDTSSQLYYQCIDVIVVTAINIFFAFFNTMKPYDFFYEKTADGFELKKKIVMDDEYIQEKISPAGNDEQQEEGYYSKISHVQGQNVALGSHNALRFHQVERINEESDYSFGSLVENKKYEDISVQALQIINDKTGTKMFDLSELQPKIQEQNSNYTVFFDKTDKNIQNTIQNEKTEKGVQRTIDQVTNKSVQPSHKQFIDQSIQGGSKNKSGIDRSIQRTVFYQDDKSMQYAPSMVSKKPSVKDQSVSMEKLSMKNQSIQQEKSVASKNIMYKPQVADRSGQMSSISKYDEGVQKSHHIDANEYSIQVSQQKTSKGNQMAQSIDEHSIQVQQQKSNKGNQKSISVGNYSVQMTKKSYADESVQKLVSLKDQQVQIDQRVQYDEVNDEMELEKTEKVIFEEDENEEEQTEERKGLIAEEKDELILPPGQIKDYKEELQERIREKEKELNDIKRKIQVKQRRNYDKKEESNDKKKGKFSVEVGKLYNKGQNSESLDQKSTIKEQSTINHGNTQPLKKQIRHIEEQLDGEIDQTLQQIEVVDDMGEKRNIKYQYKQNSQSFRDSNQTEEEYIDMLKQKQSKIVFEDSEEPSDSNRLAIESNSFKRNRPRVIEQYRSESAQISQQKGDGSTKLYSEIRNISSHRLKNKHSGRGSNQIFDMNEIDRSKNDESEEINERPFQGRPYNARSDMSDTIQEVYPHANRTVGSMKIKNDVVNDKVKEMVNHKSRSKSRKKLPDERTEKIINKKLDRQYSNNKNKNAGHERQSSLLLAGKSQFTQENLARKKIPKNSPLKTAKKWEYEHQDKNISESGDQIPNTRFRNPQRILPTETDKDETQFKFSAVKISERDLGPRGHKVVPRPFDQNRQENTSSQMSMPPIIPVNKIPVKPKLQQYESEEQSNEPYLDDDDGDSEYASRYRNNMILDQMLERPDKDDLRQYYKPSQTSRRSQEKNKKSNSQMNNETEKIYLQRLDKKWK